MFGCVQVCSGELGFVRVCLGVFDFVRIGSDMFECFRGVRVCSGVFGFVWICRFFSNIYISVVFALIVSAVSAPPEINLLKIL